MTISHGILPRRAAGLARRWMAPLARALAAIGVSANAITLIGTFLTLTAATILASGQAVLAAIVLTVASLADTLDGAVARASGSGSRVGAFLDSTVDRISDAAVLGAVMWVGISRSDTWLFWAAFAALQSSFLVSYVRAKAESLGVRAAEGPAPREVRAALLVLAIAGWGMSGQISVLMGGVVIVAALAAITFVQRTLVVVRALGAAGK